MAWITPVTNRTAGSRTTAEDMNRIVGNIAYLGGTPVRPSYSNIDIVRAEEWEYIVEFAQRTDPYVSEETGYINLNRIEASMLTLLETSKLKPKTTLKPSDTLYPNKEV